MSTTANDDGRRDYPRSQGGAAIGARLRRLSDRIDREADRVYADLGIAFEQRWFGVLNILALSGPMTVGEIAGTLGVTHPAVSQTRSGLEQRGLLRTEADPGDARRRLLTLTPEGARMAAQLRPVWAALNRAALELNAEAGDAVRALEQLEAALDRRSIAARVRTHMVTPTSQEA